MTHSRPRGCDVQHQRRHGLVQMQVKPIPKGCDWPHQHSPVRRSLLVPVLMSARSTQREAACIISPTQAGDYQRCRCCRAHVDPKGKPRASQHRQTRQETIYWPRRTCKHGRPGGEPRATSTPTRLVQIEEGRHKVYDETHQHSPELIEPRFRQMKTLSTRRVRRVPSTRHGNCK